MDNKLIKFAKKLAESRNSKNTTKKLRQNIEKSIENLSTIELEFLNKTISNLSLLKQKPPLKQ